jgi:hypothetical protein
MKIRTFVGRPRMVASMFMAALATAGILVGAHAQRRSPAAVSVGSNDLGGVVRSAKGPEVGVWVIAETTDTPTRYTKIVVTDDRGRYLIPDLPRGNYQVDTQSRVADAAGAGRGGRERFKLDGIVRAKGNTSGGRRYTQR